LSSLTFVFIGSGGTIIEGETVIKPKKQKKDINDNAIESKDVDVHKKSFRTKDRTQQRANRKRAQEKKRTIFVGNAPLTMDEKSCKKLFSHYGKIESVRMRCIFPCKETVSKRIAHISLIAFVILCIIYALYLFLIGLSNGTVLDRHRIRVDTCTSKAQYDRKLTVFVGNIPLDANEDDLANLFEENIGDVSFVRCVKDQLTGMGKGFAFVVFKSPTSVQLALSATGLHFQERELRIMKVMKKRKISTKKGSQAFQNLTKEQSTKIDQYKFSTRK
uniref:RRM domain-containing protein n=1 Tax=Angiostrongylus cantonensis TaxID=6313 RepID=A0A0K0CYQ8_ANGCA